MAGRTAGARRPPGTAAGVQPVDPGNAAAAVAGAHGKREPLDARPQVVVIVAEVDVVIEAAGVWGHGVHLANEGREVAALAQIVGESPLVQRKRCVVADTAGGVRVPPGE